MLDRTRLIVLAVLAALALAVTACDPGADPGAAPEQPDATPEDAADEDTPEPDEAADEPTPDDGYGEAPALAELVEAGELPPVDERLPDNPMVVQPHDRVGVYGGTLNSAVLGPADHGYMYTKVGYDPVMRWTLDFTESVPNIAESVEVNDDGTEFVFHLREGMRWSDGEPFTAHDIAFWYNDYELHPELGGGAPAWMVTGGEPGVVEAADDHTVVFSFSGAPNGILLERLATPWATGVASLPRHYMEQFHADYNPDVDELVAEEGLPDWIDLFDLKSGASESWLAVGRPTVKPWTMETAVGEVAQVVFERNPYYWKVDPEGQQLPYIDRVVFDVVEDHEVITFMALNGELDFHARHINTFDNKPLLADYREQGNFDFTDLRYTLANVMSIRLNMTHKDPVKREIFSNKDFRIGLSHAINREEIIDVVLIGQGEPWQVAPIPGSEYYHEQLATQYLEYDVDLANEYLDRAFPERDGDGFRLGPDGQRISFAVDTPIGTGLFTPWFVDMLEHIENHWAEVGVDMTINGMDNQLHSLRTEDNDHDATVWSGAGGDSFEWTGRPREYFPFDTSGNYAVPWARWYEGGPDADGAEEPSEAARQQMELFDELLVTVDPDERTALVHQILDIAAEEFYVMGVSLVPDMFIIVANDFHNVPDVMPAGWQYPHPGPAGSEQYFIEE